MLSSQLQGTKLYKKPAPDKLTKRDGTPRSPKKIGKIHYPVFTPDGTRVVGYMVRLPDVVGMVQRSDRFVALDAIGVYEGVVTAEDKRENFDAAAAKRLGIDLDSCLILTGMDVRTVSGKNVGYCDDAEFNPKNGKVKAFKIVGGGASNLLIGGLELPASYFKGYKNGYMVVSDEVAELSLTGGAAAKAAEASVVIADKVKRGAKQLDDKGSVAVDKGSRALGKQLGKTRGMFKSFAEEYKKAAGTSDSAGKKK